MKPLVTIFAVSALLTSPALAQKNRPPRAGMTRDRALAAAAKAFGRLDQNGDGSIDAAEVTAAMQARATSSGKPFRARAVTRTITRNDANADGKVTLDEFKTAAGAHFDQFDTNKNGTIDADEGAASTPAANSGQQ